MQAVDEMMIVSGDQNALLIAMSETTTKVNEEINVCICEYDEAFFQLFIPAIELQENKLLTRVPPSNKIFDPCLYTISHVSKEFSPSLVQLCLTRTKKFRITPTGGIHVNLKLCLSTSTVHKNFANKLIFGEREKLSQDTSTITALLSKNKAGHDLNKIRM